MKYLETITLVQFKNYVSATFNFEEKCTAFTGKNGSGKTNLLDAIYYLCFTKSYFSAKEKNNIHFNKEGFRITGIFSDDRAKTEISCLFRENKKSVFRDKVKYDKVSQHIGFQTAAIIAPDDIKIINEYSEARRKFFDGILSQMDNTYLDHILAYHHILVQKNAYLKNTYNPSIELLSVYNSQLISAGQYIIESRQQFTLRYLPLVQKYYGSISQQPEAVHIDYMPSVNHTVWQQQQQSMLHQELQQRRTLIGPHLDDWEFSIKSLPLKVNGSQGQKKSFLIALKVSQIEFYNALGLEPVILLDDIFEKLDRERLDNFFRLLSEMQVSQIFLTHTDDVLVNEIVKNHFPSVGIIKLNN